LQKKRKKKNKRDKESWVGGKKERGKSARGYVEWLVLKKKNCSIVYIKKVC
jgi:hypothetical protein